MPFIFAFFTACAIVNVDLGNGIGSQQLYAGFQPQPFALYIQSLFGVLPDNIDALVGEHTGPPLSIYIYMYYIIISN